MELPLIKFWKEKYETFMGVCHLNVLCYFLKKFRQSSFGINLYGGNPSFSFQSISLHLINSFRLTLMPPKKRPKITQNTQSENAKPKERRKSGTKASFMLTDVARKGGGQAKLEKKFLGKLLRQYNWIPKRTFRLQLDIYCPRNWRKEREFWKLLQLLFRSWNGSPGSNCHFTRNFSPFSKCHNFLVTQEKVSQNFRSESHFHPSFSMR